MRCGREAIMKSAMRVFAKKGYAGASTREICKAAGITKPVLYYHFRSKEHLYQELMIDCFSQQKKTLLRVSKAGGSLRERLVRVLYNDFREVRRDPSQVEMILRTMFAPDSEVPSSNCIEEMEQQRKVIAGFFREAVAKGEAQGDPHLLATALLGINTIAVLEYFFTRRRTLTKRNAERYVDVLLQGCRKAE
jgi:TetR/AcrR family transcriptional regulator